MFWSLRENLGGIDHLNKALWRRLLGLSPDRYLQTIDKSAPGQYRAVLDDNQSPLSCRLCGYHLLGMEITGYGFATICSSQAQGYVRNAKEIEAFIRTLPVKEQ